MNVSNKCRSQPPVTSVVGNIKQRHIVLQYCCPPAAARTIKCYAWDKCFITVNIHTTVVRRANSLCNTLNFPTFVKILFVWSIGYLTRMHTSGENKKCKSNILFTYKLCMESLEKPAGLLTGWNKKTNQNLNHKPRWCPLEGACYCTVSFIILAFHQYPYRDEVWVIDVLNPHRRNSYFCTEAGGRLGRHGKVQRKVPRLMRLWLKGLSLIHSARRTSPFL